jgi:hypothetical protein
MADVYVRCETDYIFSYEAQTPRGLAFLKKHTLPEDVGTDGRARLYGDLRINLLEWRMRRKKVTYVIDCRGLLSGHGAGTKVGRAQKNKLPTDLRERALAVAIQRALHIEDLTPAYRARHAEGCDAMTGHCFVATNAFWHATGGPAGKYQPKQVRVEGESHWFLVDDQGRIVDLTASQFSTPIPYERGRHFVMRARRGGDAQPTERAQAVLASITR